MDMPPEREHEAERLIDAAARRVAAYDRGETTGSDAVLAIARILVSLRALYPDRDGWPDMSGRSGPYRAAVRAVYERAGVPTGGLRRWQVRTRYHVSTAVREYIVAHPEELPPDPWTHYRLSRESQRQAAASTARERARLQHALEGAPACANDAADAVDTLGESLERVVTATAEADAAGRARVAARLDALAERVRELRGRIA